MFFEHSFPRIEQIAKQQKACLYWDFLDFFRKTLHLLKLRDILYEIKDWQTYYRSMMYKWEVPAMTAVIYARYSSDNQREESIEGQIRECTAYAEKKIDIVVK